MDAPDAAWDAFVEATANGDHLQTSGWARTKAQQGLESARVVLEEDGQIVGGAQMLIRRLPVAGRIGYVPRGPVVGENDVERAGSVIERLQEHVRRHRIRHLVVQPPRNGQWIADRLPAWGFSPSALAVAPTATVLIDLGEETDRLLSNMSKSTRKHVRRGESRDLEIREGIERDLPVFHSLLASSAERHGFEIYSQDYYENMWLALRPSGHVRLFLARYRDEVVSAHLVVPFGETFLSKVSAWSGRHADVYPNEVLEWHMIRWAQAREFRYYDLEGFDRPTAEAFVDGAGGSGAALRTVDAFKLKFGGRPVLLPEAFDYFPSPAVGHTYGRFYRIAASGGWPKGPFASLRTRAGRKGGM